MHDFCFTIPYGLILVAGGVIGYLKKGSIASLGGGVGTGLILILAANLSLKAFEKRKNSYFALVLETGNVFKISAFFHRFNAAMELCIDKLDLVVSLFLLLDFWSCIVEFKNQFGHCRSIVVLLAISLAKTEAFSFVYLCLFSSLSMTNKMFILFTDLYTFKPVTAAVLTWVMGQRYYQTSKIMPAGIVAGIRYVDLLLQCFQCLHIILYHES
ncbi:hypothetical protein Gogos_017758 [Gossypium gossypioides]|uniref:Uncharacterized protein n=1 Tax=Gossypium gossypioides TaxID=34282 RepID=A0A7J9BDH4_GOSGO|nr:hypothetical protein [Gossypium gossypioides]